MFDIRRPHFAAPLQLTLLSKSVWHSFWTGFLTQKWVTW